MIDRQKLNEALDKRAVQEALNQTDIIWDDLYDDGQEVLRNLMTIARVVLSAPTTRWCEVHKSRMCGGGLTHCVEFHRAACDGLRDETGCEFTSVALVPLEADE